MPRHASVGWRVSHIVFAVLLLTLACTGAAHANTFSAGQFVTNPQGAWSASPGAALLSADYDTVYAASLHVVTVGLPNSGFTMSFSAPGTILGYLPTAGTPGTLNMDVVDPSSTSAGFFGGDVLALQLNVDFNNAGFLHGTSAIPFGSLVLQNFSTLPAVNGLTVSQFLADANTCLGGGSCLYSVGTMDAITGDLNFSFSGGIPQAVSGPANGGFAFSAQTNLALPGSVTPTPEPSSVLLFGIGLLVLGIFQYKRRGGANSISV